MKFKPFFPLGILIIAVLFSCSSNNSTEKEDSQQLSFKDVNGIRFYEVKRRFSNGLSFNKDGFFLEPNWIIEYKDPDTMLAYSPELQGMERFYLHYDHGQIYNFAREFFRAKSITKDSLVLQRLQVDGRVVNKGEVSDVNCYFYTRDYIENVLKTTVGELQRPTKEDTLYIRKLSERTYKHPANPDSAFAATDIVKLKPNSKNVSAKLIGYADSGAHRKSYAYMYPEYRIEIQKSYKEFAYRFSVVVDVKGNFYVNRIQGVLKEDMPHRKKLIQGIADVYLKNLLFITPGNTLGIPHSSEITITLIGKT
jgi:hypothetical protein